MKEFMNCSLFSASGTFDFSPMGINCPLYRKEDGHLFFEEDELPIGWLSEAGEFNVIFEQCNDMGKYLAICFKDNCWRIYNERTHMAHFFTTGSGEKIYVFKLKAHYNSKIFISYNGDKNDGWFDTKNLMETIKS